MALWELLWAWLLASAVLSSAVSLCASEWRGVRSQVERQETLAMAASAQRVAQQDLHQAVAVTVGMNTMTAVLAGGIQYHYVVNAAHQWVRVRQGGGSAVLAEGVAAVSASVSSPGLVELRLRFTDGTEVVEDICTLSGMVQADESS